ncbi:MAG: nucleoside hydrolase, partial [Chloroflexota bacterium]
LVMVGLDVTTRVIMGDGYLEEIGRRGGRGGELIRQIVPCYQRFHREAHGIAGIYTHDPCAVAYAVRPELFQADTYPVSVVTSGLATGQVIVDRERRFFRETP